MYPPFLKEYGQKSLGMGPVSRHPLFLESNGKWEAFYKTILSLQCSWQLRESTTCTLRVDDLPIEVTEEVKSLPSRDGSKNAEDLDLADRLQFAEC